MAPQPVCVLSFVSPRDARGRAFRPNLVMAERIRPARLELVYARKHAALVPQLVE